MASTALDNLQAAIQASAAQGPFALDAAYLTSGLADPSVTVPPRYDADLAAAFQVAAADFTITVAPADVGPVADNRFTVRRASLPFLGVALKGTGTLVFSLAENDTVLVVQIASAPPAWTWTTSFPAMTGWLFSVLPVGAATFVFSTRDGNYPFGDTGGVAVTGGSRQNAAITTVVPAAARTLFALFDPVITAPPSIQLRGALDLSAYNGQTILYPAGTLRGGVSDASFKLLYLDVIAPALALTIPPPINPAGPLINDRQQTPQLSIAADLRLDGAPSAYSMRVAVSQPPTGRVPFSIGLRADATGPQLTPATMLALAGGPSSGGQGYLAAVPPVLQQFMTSVSLRGLSLAGTLAVPPAISMVGLEIGSVPGMSWTPIPDAPAGLDFTFTSFSLAWSLISPFDAKARQQAFVFSTQFTLAPAIFKGKTPGTDGVFTVTFDSGLQFAARFDGIASLRDFVDVLSGHAVTLPDGVDASVSGIAVNVDYPGRGFQFGSGFDVKVSFLEVGGQPILAISNGRVNLGAMTPTQPGGGAPGKTVWQAGIAGTLAVGPVGANVSVTYDGFQTPPRWLLAGQLAQPVEIESVIQQFFDPSGGYQFPDFLPGTITLNTLSIAAQLGAQGGQPPTTYAIDTTFSWLFDLGDQKVGIDPAHLMLAYDGAKPAGQQFSGLAEGTWVYTAINLQLKMGYQFVPTAQGTNNILYVEWEGFRASYESGKEQITFSLRGWTVGTLIQALVRTLGDPYFTLPSPWDLLNAISLDGLSLIVSLKSNVQNRISAAYTLSSPINLGFIIIKGLIFRRDTDGKVTLAIDGTVPAPLQGQMGNLLDPAKGQDVQNMPSVPGAGEAYFKLFLLALGQRIGITGHESFRTTQEAIRALEGVPSTTSKQNPVNPTANQGAIKGIPYYEPANNWLIAGHMGVLQIAGVWTIDAMVVFNDPELYGLRLALAGPRAGGLAGLAVDILYKKITDDVGVFQIEFTFPDAIRNLNFGAVSIVLPQIGVQVYTNGDFFIDIGFPYNNDFRRSFSISAIVYGVPVLGSGGLYFGKLSSATATQVPRTELGTFDPVIVFGLGLQLGLGYNFIKGPLQAGFALTVFGIIEGVIAPWHPYTPALPSGGLSLQDEYYFKLSGTVGIIGLLYGKVDFAIIQASVNVNITLSLKITYESFRAIPIVATAKVDISLKVKIDLGLFSISISLSFTMTVSATFVIGSDQVAPWDDAKLGAAESARRRGRLTQGPAAIRARAKRLRPAPKRRPDVRAADKPRIGVIAAPQYTVLAPEDATDPAHQEGAFVFLLAMDAPAADSAAPDPGTTSFGALCAAYFPWMIDALGGNAGAVTRDEIEAFVARLADDDDPAFTTGDLLGFLGDHFTLDIATTPASAQRTRDAMSAGATLFPVFDGLSLSVPDPSGGDPRPIPFETYATATSGYRSMVAKQFAEVEVRLSEDAPGARMRAAEDDPESMAALVFTDTFSIIGRQLLQAALGALETYVYKLTNSPAAPDSIAWILGWANGLGNRLVLEDVALPNQDHGLTAANRLAIAGLTSTLQANDTLTTVAARYSDPSAGAAGAARWTTTPSSLVLANADARVLQAGVTLDLEGASGPVDYPTQPGDSFAAIARSLDITLDELALQPGLTTAEGLLTPAGSLAIPVIAYTTASGDTLRSVAAQFAVTVPALAAANLAVAGLFSLDAEGGVIALANLTTLPAANLWSTIQATDQVAQTAGMVSRFLMFGLRLPSGDGLGLSKDFLYPRDQTAYALYQLTGQEFPVPPALVGGTYGIDVARADASHGVSLDFIELNGSADKHAALDLTSAYGLLELVATWARTGAFQPAPSFTALPLANAEVRRLALSSPALWSTSDRTSLGRVTDRGAGPGSALAQPTLWSLPSGLLAETAARQAALAAAFPALSDLVPRMPRYVPSRVATSATGDASTATPLRSFAWATRVDVQIKRLSALSVAGAEPQGEGSVPDGPALASSQANVYELVAPSSDVATQLASLLRAIDALGADVVSGAFLLYGKATGAAVGSGDAIELVTLGDTEFLSFITQTNLSTDANPDGGPAGRTADAEPPHGIANSPAELVRLLWELSVVRNGGYYLYYRVLDGDAGLPPALFDASGSATVSFVVTFAAHGDASSGDAVLDFVNGFVTTDNIDRALDIVELSSAPGATQTSPLAGNERLADIAATYGVTPGQLATRNPEAVATTGKIIPIAGIVRQLLPADVVDPGTTLARLAAYYSAGAQTPITADDIAAINPGVVVELAAVFYIPTVRYVVAAGAAPGTKLGAIAAYYAISLDALAVLAFGVDGLLVAGTVLAVDTQGFELRTTLGPANVGIALERANLGEPVLPPNPTPPEKAAFARASMYALYNTLSAGFRAGTYVKTSPLGLPFGPQSDPTAAADAEPAHPMRAAAHRRARLAAVADADFRYQQLLGLGDFPTVNAAIDLPDLAPAADSPYIGVGTPAQIALQWQDLFGNTTVTPFTVVPNGYTGAINGEAVRIRYADALVGPAAWPQALLYYAYAGDSGSATVDLQFQLDTASYVGQPDQAARDLALYRLVYYQLHQDYTGKGVPGVTGNAVAMQVSNSLLAAPLHTLDDNEAKVIRRFVTDCARYLAAIVGGKPLPAQPTATLSLPVALSAISSSELVALDVTLTFARNPLLVDPTTASLPGGLNATGPVLPKPDGGSTIAYTGFATRFENIFQTTGAAAWQLRIGEGLRARVGGSGTSRGAQLWAVRFGDGGIAFQIGDTASYYAPLPIARTLVNRSATIVQYPSGAEVTSAFTAVDQNLWFQNALDAIDTFLSGETSTSVFVLDQLLGTSNPLEDGYLGKVLVAKRSLADSISATSAPILSTSADDASAQWAAQATLRQQLLAQLGAAYAAGATLVFEVDDVTGGTGTLPPRLYGQPAGTLGAGAINQDYTLSPARLPLGPTTIDGATYDPRLAFVMTTKNVAAQAYVPLDLRYPISHLEFDRAPAPGTSGYVQSRWLAFVTGAIDRTLGAGTSNIPVVNRALPVPPTMTQQTGDKLIEHPVTAGELPLWSYRFEVQSAQAAQDAVSMMIQLNVPIGATAQPRAAGPDLFTALAQLVTNYPAIAADLALSLPKIGAGTADDATVKLAQQAVQAFQVEITAIAEAHAASVTPVAAAEVEGAPELIQVTMNTRLDRTDGGDALTEILALAINGVAATWDPGAGTISNGTIVLPEVRIEIAPELYQLEPVTPPPPNVVIAYRYRAADGTYLTFEGALAIATRGVALRGLNVLVHQNAWSSLEVQRNRILTPIADAGRIHTREDFVFQTPTVRFTNPIVPRLEHATFSLDGVAPPDAELAAVLDAFYAALFAGGDGSIATGVAMTGAYSYRLIAGAPRTVLPIAMVPPTDTPVTPAAAPAFVAPFAELIDTWIAAQAPTLQGEPQLDFTATLFATTGARQPILVVHDLPRTVSAASSPERGGRR